MHAIKKSRNVNAAIDGIDEAIFSQAGEGVVYRVQRKFSSRKSCRSVLRFGPDRPVFN
jgi:hypothetical protein